MKKIVLLITLLSFGISQAQIVNIPDVNFKNRLLAASPSIGVAFDINDNRITIDINNDGEIQESEALNVHKLYVASRGISDLTGISSFTNLTYLNCSSNPLTSLDVSSNVNLTDLYCNSNQLTSLDVSSNVNLTDLYCYSNQLTSLDVSSNVNLTYLNCFSNQLTSLDVSSNMNLTYLNCHSNQLTSLDVNNVNLTYLTCSSNQLTSLDVSNNVNLTELEASNNLFEELDLSNLSNLVYSPLEGNLNLTYINFKNGNNDNYYVGEVTIYNLPNLEIICVDNINSDFTNNINQTGHPVTFTEYCSLSPAQSNEINGDIKLDMNNNGCDSSDISIPNLMVLSNNGTETFSSFTQNNGSYQLYTNEGDFTTTANLNIPSYFIVNPTSHTNNFTGFDNTFTADFCITANQTINDVNITLVPLSESRPGFDAMYQLVYTNVGTTQLSGDVTLNFDDASLNFLNASETIASQTANSLTFSYTDLNPFETRTIGVEFNVFTPPTVNIDDVLNFTATINPISGDNTPEDNVFELNQTVIGSYDPNDITCLEGDEILDTETDKYLHYVIRFQNTGTASAINVVVKNVLDNQLDWNTLQLQSYSHDMRTAIKNGNEIEFIFEDIQLADSTNDEPNSHGFIAYKIKPKSTVTLGDIIPNKADIFFDFNEAIETNTANVEVVNVLSTQNNELVDFSIFPIPADNILQISSKTEITYVNIYSKLGQLVLSSTSKNIDISNLSSDIYFIKIMDENGNSGTKKIIKK